MGLFKIVQEVLCLCLMEEIIDKKESALLYEAYRPSNPPFPHPAYGKFSLANKDPAECKADFLYSNAAMEQFSMESRACV